MITGDLPLTGTFHVFIAFDWGDEIRLDEAARLWPARSGDLVRRSRTPQSFSYRPIPLRFELAPLEICLPEIGSVSAAVEATAFDFGAVSISLHVPFSLTAGALLRLAGWLSEPGPLVQAAASASDPLFGKLLPAIRQALRADLSEEYFVFQFTPEKQFGPIAELLQHQRSWLARLVRLEGGELSEQEIAEALRDGLSYSPSDLFLCQWAAAVLIDAECVETLQTIEFANVQLLEFRHIDRRLDDRLESAYQLIYPLARTWLPFWRNQARSLRALGEMKVEANGLFERASSALKLVGDQYLARVYRLLAMRFHLEQWEKNIRQSLQVVQEVYQVVSDQAATYRTELLEAIVIVLILVEVLIAIWRH